MRWLLLVALTWVMGIATASQLAMLGALGEQFGIVEGAWISILLTMGAGALLLALRGAVGRGAPRFAAPLHRPWPHLLMAVVTLVGYGLSLKGVPAEFTMPGLLGLIAMIATSWIIPRTGAAVFLVATSAGLLAGGIVLDHFAWLGTDEQRIDLARGLGVVLLMGGVALISRGDVAAGVSVIAEDDETNHAQAALPDDRSAADAPAGD